MTMRRLMTWLFGAFLLLLREDAFALGLLDGYHLALENDPQFQAAIQEHEAGRQYRALGRAALLPRLVYSYNRGRSWSDVTQATTRGDFKEDRDYDSYVSTLSLQQPLFDYEAFSRYRKGVAQALLSDERFRSQSQELLVRVLEAYTGALLAQDQIELARAQKRSYREQFQLNQRQFERGNGTRTDTLETQARFNLAQAQEIEARDSQDAALRELERLVGAPLEIADLAPLGERFQVRPLSPASYTAWRDLALAENPELASLRHAVDVARYEVEQNRADFLPRLGLYASTGKSKSGSENTYNQRYETDSVGIQLSVPLFSGGETLAATRQATHRMEKSHYDLDDKVRETLNQAQDVQPEQQQCGEDPCLRDDRGFGADAGDGHAQEHRRRGAGQPRPAERRAGAVQRDERAVQGQVRLPHGLGTPAFLCGRAGRSRPGTGGGELRRRRDAGAPPRLRDDGLPGAAAHPVEDRYGGKPERAQLRPRRTCRQVDVPGGSTEVEQYARNCFSNKALFM